MASVRVLLRRHRPGGAVPAPAPAAGPGVGPTAQACCQAPFGALFFDPLGDVYPCCSSGYPLGNVTRERLGDIWQGVRLDALRGAVLDDDYSLGCGHCEQRHDAEIDSLKRHFDNVAPDTLTPAHPRKLVFSLSNSCNLRCIQCSGDFSSSVRVAEGRPALPKVYGEDFFTDLAAMVPHLDTVHFLGGEPFLVAEYPRVWDLLAAHNPDVDCYLTTNATQWNARVERVLAQLRFNLEVSIDGFREDTFERIRVGADHGQVMRNVERFAQYAREVGTTLQINHCLMPQNYDEFGDLLLFADALDAHVQVSIVVTPSECTLEDVEDWPAVVRSFERQAEEIRPRLGRNAAVFDDQFHRVTAAGMARPRAVVGLVHAGHRPFGREELAAAVGRTVDQLPSSQVTVDLHERVADVSEAFTALTGVRRTEVLGGDLGALDEALAAALGPRSDLVTTSATEDLVVQEVTYGHTRLHTFVAAERDHRGRCRSVHIHLEPAR